MLLTQSSLLLELLKDRLVHWQLTYSWPALLVWYTEDGEHCMHNAQLALVSREEGLLHQHLIENKPSSPNIYLARV